MDSPNAPLADATAEALTMKRFLYHLFRLDDACRAFQHIPQLKTKPSLMGLMRRRWEIGLTLEMVSNYDVSAS